MKRFWKKVRLYTAAYARPVILSILAVAGLVALFTYKLDGLVPGLSRPELQSLSFSNSLDAIRYNPVSAPVTLLHYFLQTSHFDTTFALRLASAIFGVFSVGAFYLISRNWYSQSVSALGTILYASSSWLLHTSRLAVPLALQTLVIFIVLFGVQLQRNKGSKPTIFFGVIFGALLAYIPGMLCLLVVGIVWQRARIVRAIKRNEGWFGVLCVTIGIAILLPLFFAIFVDPLILRPLLGVPAKFPTVLIYIKNGLQVPVQLFFRGPNDPVIWLGRLPLLEVFSSLMFIIGLYAAFSRLLLDRIRVVLGLCVGLWLLISLGGSVQIAALLPLVFLVITAGIAYMLEAWLTIFPRNPVARGTGLLLMSLAVGAVVYFHISSYFLAWPHTPTTKAVFSVQQR